MAWFSSGFSNLKEQLNSLINDDDGIGSGSPSHADSVSSSDADGKGEPLLRNLRNYAETTEQDETSMRNRSSFVQRRRIIQYSRMLNDLTNDVNILHTSLDQVLDDVVKCIDENERLREEITIREDGDDRNVNALLDKTRTDNVAVAVAVAVADKQDDGFGYSSECGQKTAGDQCNTIAVDASLIGQVRQRRSKTATTNEKTKAIATAAVTSVVGLDGEITEKIENLMIEMDEINEKLNRSERSWRKATEDGISCAAMHTNALAEYTTLARRRDALWEKLKVSFIWPTIAKFKNANISELSVPDSVKEVFQPAAFVARSNDEEFRRQQLAQSEASATGSPDEGESTFAVHLSPPPPPPPPPPLPSPPPCSKNDGESTSAATARKAEKLIETKVNESPLAVTDAAVAEINRLRNHLVSVEQAYTNELLQCEEEIKILRSELKIKEDKLNSIAASYTATNLCTNKALERLQLEVNQLSNDNQQLTTQLDRCRRDLEESRVDTRNLRSALDFFRKDKDSEICQATEKLKSEIRALRSDNERLRGSLASLQNNVDDSQQIFKKNEILSEELKRKLDEIDALQRKMDDLLRQRSQNANTPEEGGERSFETATTTTTTARTRTLDVEAKMRLNLIKNVAFRYLTSDSSTTKSQSLRILADVLELSDCEKMKIGIKEPSAGMRSSDKETKSNQSLIDEFIRFVEKESHPRTILAEERQLQRQRQSMQKRPRSAASSSDLSLTDAAVAVVSSDNTMNLPPALNLTSSSILLKDVLSAKDI